MQILEQGCFSIENNRKNDVSSLFFIIDCRRFRLCNEETFWRV